MSHFVTFVLIDGALDGSENGATDYDALAHDAQDRIADLLAPYDENIEVPEYERDCYCVGSAARTDAAKASLRECGYEDWHGVRAAFKSTRERVLAEHGVKAAGSFDWDEDATPEQQKAADAAIATAWQEHIAPITTAEKRILDSHPLCGKSDPDCDECNGTGRETSTYNPRSKWDWWVMGGRWPGIFEPDYEARQDPDNYEPCWLCSGTGTRPDGDRFGAGWLQQTGGCNGCRGTGQALKFRLKQRGIAAPAQVAAAFVHTDKASPYALVTPDGEWFGQGEMGWFGMSRDDLPEPTWRDLVIAKLREHPTALVVSCDLHI